MFCGLHHWRFGQIPFLEVRISGDCERLGAPATFLKTMWVPWKLPKIRALVEKLTHFVKSRTHFLLTQKYYTF